VKQKNDEEGWNMVKKGIKSHFGYKLRSIMYRDYELIKRFKTAI
jgi:hypothetical protein